MRSRAGSAWRRSSGRISRCPFGRLTNWFTPTTRSKRPHLYVPLSTLWREGLFLPIGTDQDRVRKHSRRTAPEGSKEGITQKQHDPPTALILDRCPRRALEQSRGVVGPGEPRQHQRVHRIGESD